jgi:hypothetical protein
LMTCLWFVLLLPWLVVCFLRLALAVLVAVVGGSRCRCVVDIVTVAGDWLGVTGLSNWSRVVPEYIIKILD